MRESDPILDLFAKLESLTAAATREDRDDIRDQLGGEICDAEVEIFRTSALTLKGIIAKSRLARHIAYGDGDEDYALGEQVLIGSLLKDLEALGARAA